MSNTERGPEQWVRRRLRGQGPGGRLVQDAAGNSVWVRTRATDPPERMVDESGLVAELFCERPIGGTELTSEAAVEAARTPARPRRPTGRR